MKTYKTGDIVKIFGVSPKMARKWLDESDSTEFVESKFKRRSTRRINAKGLVRLLVKKGLSFDLIDLTDFGAQKAILCYKQENIRALIHKAQKRGNPFLKIKLFYSTNNTKKRAGHVVKKQAESMQISQSSEILLAFCRELGPIENVQGVARNVAWQRVFEAITDFIAHHTKVCLAISRHKKSQD
jgi:hypothetical protein